MFVLNLRDNLANDAILFGGDAETFLGVTAQEFDANQQLRNAVYTQLQLWKSNKTFLTVHLKLYLVKNNDAISLLAGSKRRRNQSEDRLV
jgi:hypothetical protein